jgi:hypothetical protein
MYFNIYFLAMGLAPEMSITPPEYAHEQNDVEIGANQRHQIGDLTSASPAIGQTSDSSKVNVNPTPAAPAEGGDGRQHKNGKYKSDPKLLLGEFMDDLS